MIEFETPTVEPGAGRRPTIAISNPYIWPHVRRGSERLLNDLSHYLNQQGYPVEVYAMAPKAEHWVEEGIAYHTVRRRLSTPLRQVNDCHYFAFALPGYLEHSKAEIIHCLNYFDAFAAITARRRYHKDYRIVFHAVGIPTARYFRSVPIDAYFMRQTLKHADAVFSLSRFATTMLARDFGRQADMLPPPVLINEEETLNASSAKDLTAPKILFVGDLLEPRKGALTACRAFLEIRKAYPDATLCLSGNVNQQFIDSLFADPAYRALEHCIELPGLGTIEALKEQYRRASVCLLPSVWEAFGLVLIEALAQGTPVVGTRHGGITDIIPEGCTDLGCLFPPGEFDRFTRNWRGLADAIEQVLEHTAGRDVRRACRQRAMDFSWQKLGPQYEAHYSALLAGVEAK